MAYRDPKPEDLNRPEFNAVWEEIKRWDINVPDQYVGYTTATGGHVMAILDAIEGKIMTNEYNKALKDDSYRDHLVEELIDGIFYSMKIKDDKKAMTFNEYQEMARRTSNREREVQWRLLIDLF